MKNRMYWDDGLIAAAVLEASKEFGRMPSVSELRGTGREPLANAVARHGGLRTWASRLGLRLKNSETKLGQDFEISEAVHFSRLGYKTERQTCKGKYDLLVNHKRIDVKVSHLYKCKLWQGYAFAGMKRGKDCDFFDCLILDGKNVLHRLFIPAKKIKTVTLTITIGGVSNKTHWAMQYENATHLLGKP